MEEDNKKVVKQDWIKLDPHMNMSDLTEVFPELVEVLTYEYGLHCVNCMLNEFDTLSQGAVIHGIEGKDFDDMIKHLEEVINTKE